MRRVWTILAAAWIVAGCGETPTAPEDGAIFVVEVSGEEFRALVTDDDVVADLEARLDAGTEGVISGALASGDGGFNAPWSWHWEPESVHVADFAIEVCDGRPSMVEDDLTYWLDTVEQFCPWGATVVRRER